jgi:hypothetical protein
LQKDTDGKWRMVREAKFRLGCSEREYDDDDDDDDEITT